jgi:excisionase family DNA binding protein
MTAPIEGGGGGLNGEHGDRLQDRARLWTARGNGVGMQGWWNVREAATYAGVSRDTVYTACARGELQHARIGGRRAIRLKADWMDTWVERHTRGAGSSSVPSNAT